MWTQFAVANVAIGARNIGHAPAQIATPRVIITRLRYIGLRVNRNGPDVTRTRFAGDVGLISVRSRRNSNAADMASRTPVAIRMTPSGTMGRPGTGAAPIRWVIT